MTVSCEVQHCVTTCCRAGAQSVNMMLLIYISAGVAAFILLSVGGYCCMKCEYCPSQTFSPNSSLNKKCFACSMGLWMNDG